MTNALKKNKIIRGNVDFGMSPFLTMNAEKGLKDLVRYVRNTTWREYKRSGTDCYQIAGKEETTQMFKIAICDDENLFTEELKELISGYMMEKGLAFEIDIYSSGEALIELGIEVVRYTIVFLDINMEES